MKEKRSAMDLVDAKRDEIGKKLSDKNIELPIELISGVLFLMFAIAIFLLMPSQVPVSKNDVVDGRAFPKLLAAIMALSCFALIVKELYGHFVRKQPWTTKKINLLVEVKALAILMILVLTYLICKATGLFVIGACFCAVCFLLFFRCRKKSYYAITVCAAILIWVAFRFGLGVRF